MQNKKKKVTLLDCTFRDGGYYNQWQYGKKLVEETVAALVKANINIVELGYKSSLHRKNGIFQGLFRYCPESQLEFLRSFSTLQFAVMLDVKEFILEKSVDQEALQNALQKASDSLFSWVRLACTLPNFKEALEMAKILKDWGYQICLNLMGIALIPEEKLIETLRSWDLGAVDVFYFADSYGNFQNQHVLNFIKILKENFKGKIGIHTHDNVGLAFSNTLTAIENGVDFVDSSILGMGRGAGNLKTEQLLLHLYFYMNEKKNNPYPLLDVIDKYFKPLKNRYQWGWDYTYMLSALQNIHPTYCMELRTGDQYSDEQIDSIFGELEAEKRSKYDKKSLNRAINHAIHHPFKSEEALYPLPFYEPPKAKEVLVIGKGPGVDTYIQEIKDYITEFQPLVIECHPAHTDFEENAKDYMMAILNWNRLKRGLGGFLTSKAKVITGVDKVPLDFPLKDKLYCIPCDITADHFKIDAKLLSLPAYMVGMFAISAAYLCGPEKIILAGFDGYADESLSVHKEMKQFLEKVKNLEVQICSITPTNYPIPVASIYQFIH